MSHASATLHELHLLLVYLGYAAIGVGMTVKTYHKAVAQRAYLVIIAYTCHGATLRHHVAEVVEQLHNLGLRHGIGIFILDTHYLRGYAAVHMFGSQFIDIAGRILKGILAHPYASSKLVAVKIFHRGLICLIVSICLVFHNMQ